MFLKYLNSAVISILMTDIYITYVTHTHNIYSEWQTLIVSLNFTKIINLFFKSDWLITTLFQGQQRCWSRNMSHLVKSGSAWRDTPPSIVTHTLNLCSALIHLKCTHSSEYTHTHTHTHTHLEQWAAIYAASPGEQLGVQCLAQGHLVVVLKEESAVHSLPPPTIPAGPRL